MPKRKFIEGEKVAHISNLKLELFVNRIIFKSVRIPVIKEKEVVDKNVSKIVGIEVTYSDPENGKLIKNVFHSSTLVPWDIAQKGEIEASKYLENNINYEKPKQ